MGKENLISVIVPVYNTQNYLPKCLESLQKQTYTNFEVILVNDGSTDESGKICDEFAEKDERIKVEHLTNKGVSFARNVGLDLATGEFISFVDSDDTVEKNFLEILHNNFIDNVDIVICGYNSCNQNGRVETVYKAQQDEVLLTRDETIETMLYGKIFAGHCWNKMFRKSVLGELRFREDILIYEDLLFVSEYLMKSNSAKLCSAPVYNYFCRSDSALHGKMTKKKLTALTALNVIEDMLRQTYGAKFDELIAYDRLCWAIDCYRILCYDKGSRKEYTPLLKTIVRQNKKNKLMSAKMRFKINLLSINPKLFYLIRKVTNKG